MSFSPLLKKLVEELQILPGIGPKSAQRMAFHLLERQRNNGQQLATTLHQALQNIGYCNRCRNFSETELCTLCSNSNRNAELLCIVESPADIIAIEQTGKYHGLYFVLMGKLSPLDGIGPKELGLDQLKVFLDAHTPKEIILAINPTIEGNATSHYLTTMIKPLGCKITQIAHGVPLGGELEYTDANTLAHALSVRETIQ